MLPALPRELRFIPLRHAAERSGVSVRISRTFLKKEPPSRPTVFARSVHPVFGGSQAGAGGRTRTRGLCLVSAALCPLSYTRNSHHEGRGYSGPVLSSRRGGLVQVPPRALPSTNRSRGTAPETGARQGGAALPPALAPAVGNGWAATRCAVLGGGRRRPPSSRGSPAPRRCAGRCGGRSSAPRPASRRA